MGLPISRSIIEAHEGRLWAENNADRGDILFHCAGNRWRASLSDQVLQNVQEGVGSA